MGAGLAVLARRAARGVDGNSGYRARIHSEEVLLRTQFGSDHDAYCARTSRLIPGLY
jgi:protein-S-isoprenylcysteine O-methyltransferase Ste14